MLSYVLYVNCNCVTVEITRKKNEKKMKCNKKNLPLPKKENSTKRSLVSGDQTSPSDLVLTTEFCPLQPFSRQI